MNMTDEELNFDITVQRGFIGRQRMIVRQAEEQLLVDIERLRRLLAEKARRTNQPINQPNTEETP